MTWAVCHGNKHWWKLTDLSRPSTNLFWHLWLFNISAFLKKWGLKYANSLDDACLHWEVSNNMAECIANKQTKKGLLKQRCRYIKHLRCLFLWHSDQPALLDWSDVENTPLWQSLEQVGIFNYKGIKWRKGRNLLMTERLWCSHGCHKFKNEQTLYTEITRCILNSVVVGFKASNP